MYDIIVSQEEYNYTETEKQKISTSFSNLVPSMPPTNVKARNTSSTSIEITWQPLANPVNVHGILRGYRVVHARDDGIGATSSTMTAPGSLALVLSNLDKYRRYTFKVLAFTVKGDGPLSTSVICSTDEDGKLTHVSLSTTSTPQPTLYT